MQYKIKEIKKIMIWDSKGTYNENVFWEIAVMVTYFTVVCPLVFIFSLWFITKI